MSEKNGRRLRRYLDLAVPFTPALFSAGDPAFAPVLCWEWLRVPSPDEIKDQLESAKKAGFGAVYILPMPKEFRPDTMITELEGYLTPPFFDAVRAALERAENAGLRLWLYDEGGWPSGAACGAVVRAKPETAAKRLCRVGGTFEIRPRGGNRPDIYDETAARYFTQITHRAYASALGPLAGRVEAMFTDEPAGAPDAMNEEIETALLARYGDDARAVFDAILDRSDGDGTKEQARLGYYALLGTLFRRTLRIWKEENEKHGWLTVGHLDRDHTCDACLTKGYGNVLAALKRFDIPGVDAIGGQISSAGNRTDGNAVGFYPRFAASAAAQNGTPLALTESFAVYGNALTGDELRYILNAQLVRGVNLFNFMTMPSTLEKWYACSERPYFHPSLPGFFALDGLCRELERSCLFMATGLHAAGTALLYPYEDFLRSEKQRARAAAAFKAAGDALERDGIDFDLIDADTVRTCNIKDGALCCGGARYTRVVVPAGCGVPADAAEKLAALRGDATENAETENNLFLCRTVADARGDRHICLFNESRETRAARVRVNGARRLYLCDPRSGELFPFENGAPLKLYYGQCALLLDTDARYETPGENLPTEEAALRPVSAAVRAEFRVTRAGARLERRDRPIAPPTGGAADFPPGFCGELEYAYAFDADGGAALRLELDRLAHFAEVFVNGVRAGSLFAAPYGLTVPAGMLRKGENRLTLRVASLAGLAYANARPERFFTKAQLGPYHLPALEAENQLGDGGFGGLRAYFCRS